jgi:phosphatidylserine synthase 2
MVPFVPDIDYHIQAVFILAFGYIWGIAFVDDYLTPTPTDPEAEFEVTQANVYRAIYSCIVFLVAFSYLEAYPEYGLGKWQQRFHRMHVMLTLCYMCFIIFMFNMRPDQGRNFLGYLDPSLNKKVTKEMHTYDDNCEFTWDNFISNFDHYYCVHLGNWFLASFVIRDAYMLHFWHIFDEIIELSW